MEVNYKDSGKTHIRNKNIVNIEHEGRLYSNMTISNLFNNYYADLVDKEILLQIIESSLCVRDTITEAKFISKPVSESDLESIIMELENKYTIGYDDVPIIVLKFAKDYLIKPLTHLINSSFISGICPSKLKVTKVKPLHKKGECNRLLNYRPIAISPVISKLYERVMYYRLVGYFEEKKLFDEEQHGFRSDHSSITATIKLIDSIVGALDQSEKAIGIFMDLN